MANEAFDLSEWINLSPVPQSPATTLPESGDRTDAQQYALLENNRSGYLANSVINPQAPEPQGKFFMYKIPHHLHCNLVEYRLKLYCFGRESYN